ncbi:MAG: cell division protein ZapE [Variibacter sp.]
MPSVLIDRYRTLVAAGEIERDPAQEAVLARLEALRAELVARRGNGKASALGWLLGRKEERDAIKGVYLYGSVGRGKTMLMDLFFAAAPAERKRRAHFHEFMLDVHERVHAYRQKQKRGEMVESDPITLVAADISAECSLLCFDEFHVTDIADAMILGRLFTQLFKNGLVVVATSNVAPDDLYAEGLNRALFLPFIELLESRVDVMRLDARTDFRLEKLAGAPVWHVPGSAAADAAMNSAWRRLTSGSDAAPIDLQVKGRKIHVPRAAMGVARFAFKDICGVPLAAADYLKIAHEFHTLLIDRIPAMDFARRNEAKRFIILIDTLYDYGVKLVASAEAEPVDLYTGENGYEALEFNRTASRLIEMRSEEYLALPHGSRAAAGEVRPGVVET